MAVEAARPDDSGVDQNRIVAGTDHHDAFPALEPIKLLEQSVGRLDVVGGVVADDRVPVAEGIEFVNKQDCGRLLRACAKLACIALRKSPKMSPCKASAATVGIGRPSLTADMYSATVNDPISSMAARRRILSHSACR